MKSLLYGLLLFFSSSVIAMGDLGVLFPVHTYETVYTDLSRTRNGSVASNPDNVNGPRLINVRVFMPAVSAGTGNSLRMSVIPMVFNGTFANQPLITSDRKLQLFRSWDDNVPRPGAFPIVLMNGGSGGILAMMILAENIAAAGYIVLVPTGYGIDPSACPTCGPAVSRTLLRDGRNVLSAAENSLLGFNSNKIKKDSKGMIAGCVGGSRGASVCIQTAAGTLTLDANSQPNENATDPRIRAVFAGDGYLLPSPGFNENNFTAALATYTSGLYANWPRDFAIYQNASQRIFYDLRTANHNIGYMGSDLFCQYIKEIIRVNRDGPLGNGDAPAFLNEVVLWAFEGCSPQYLTGLEFLPTINGLPGSLAALLPKTPLGVSTLPNQSIVNFMTAYYNINFLNARLKGDPIAAILAKLPIFPGLLDNIYVNSVPRTAANNFNLQNSRIDIKPIPGSKRYKTTITTRSGPIPDPSTIPGAYSLFGANDWDDNLSPPITPAFGSFPILNGNITSSNSISINSNGYIKPESGVSTLDGIFAATRLKGWFEDQGSWTIACFGSDVAGGGPGPEAQIWVSNTPERLQLTWYQVFSYEFPNLSGVNAQCTLFPDGSIRLEYDNSIPSPGVLTGEFEDAGTLVIGISNGRLHLKDGIYNFLKKPQIKTFTQIKNGASTKDADAIYEVYTQEVPAQ